MAILQLQGQKGQGTSPTASPGAGASKLRKRGRPPTKAIKAASAAVAASPLDSPAAKRQTVSAQPGETLSMALCDFTVESLHIGVVRYLEGISNGLSDNTWSLHPTSKAIG